MTKYAKWLGVGLGWVLGGPIGAVLGLATGAAVDVISEGLKTASKTSEEGRYKSGGRNYKRKGARGQANTSPGDFNVSLLVLSAAVMKADGKILKSELDYVKAHLVKQFGQREAQNMLPLLKDLLKQNYDIRLICMQIQRNMPHSLRLHMFQYLVGIANADNSLHWTETNLLHKIASYLNISKRDYDSILGYRFEENRRQSRRKSQKKYGSSSRSKSSSNSRSRSQSRSKSRSSSGYQSNSSASVSLGSAYKMLGVLSTASDSEVKKAWRRMAKKYHPDRLVGLSKAHIDAGEDKFQVLTEAYEKIKAARGMK